MRSFTKKRTKRGGLPKQLDVAVEVGVDALVPEDTTTRLFDLAEDVVVKERLILESGCIVLTFETGSGNNSTPILLIETDLDMQVFDWATKVPQQEYITDRKALCSNPI